MIYYIGKPVRLRLRLYDEDNAPRIGYGIYSTIELPSVRIGKPGALITISAGQIVNPSLGIYSYLYTPALAGGYVCRWYETIYGATKPVLADKVSFRINAE
jgi:hypothetical protein